MEKKKLLFVCYGMGIGGIEKCLINLLNVMNPEDYAVDVLLMHAEYDLMYTLQNTNVRFLDSFRYTMSIEYTPDEIRNRGGVLKHPIKTLAYMDFRLRIKRKGEPWKVFRNLPDVYDVAVAYSQNDFSPYYVIDRVKAHRKVLWYHNGAYEGTGRRMQRDKAYYHRFDKVVAVSNDCAAMLQKKFSFPDGKLIVLKNIPDAKTVRKKAREPVPESLRADTFHIVTVGRMTSEKGADLVLEACRELAADGRKFCWHWVGSGNQEEKVAEQVHCLGLKNYFIAEGNQKNPYPFIKNADLYVQPSYYEAYSTTVTEARILAVPIVTTDVGGMRDQLTDQMNALIVPVDAEAIAEAVGRLMEDHELRRRFSEALRKENFDPGPVFEEYKNTVFA